MRVSKLRGWAPIIAAGMLALPMSLGAVSFHNPEQCDPPPTGCPQGSSWMGEPICGCVSNECEPPPGGCPPGREWLIDPEANFCGCVDMSPCPDPDPCDCDEMLLSLEDRCTATCVPIKPAFTCAQCEKLSEDCLCEPDPAETPCCFDPEPMPILAEEFCTVVGVGQCSGTCFRYYEDTCDCDPCCEKKCEEDDHGWYPVTRKYHCNVYFFDIFIDDYACTCNYDKPYEVMDYINSISCLEVE